VHASFAGVDFRLGHWPDHENFWGAGPCPLPPNGYDQWVWDHSAALDDILQTRSGIYTGQSHWNSYVRSARHGFRPLWQARYPYGRTPAPGMPTPDLDHFPDDWEDWAMRRPPTPPVGWNQWDGWQFSSAGPGQLYGASSDGLDLCLFRLDTEDAELTPEQARKLDEVHTLLTQGALGYGVEPVAPQVSKNGRLLRSICQKLGIPT
jgi:hypothetical protein